MRRTRASLEFVDPAQSLRHVDSTFPRPKADATDGNNPLVSRLPRLVDPRFETLEVLLNLGEPGAQAIVPSVRLTEATNRE